MLTFEEVKNITFRRANFGGYKPEDVDNFIDEVQDSYEKLLNERENFITRVEELTKKVKVYEAEAKSIKQVIESAKDTAETALNEASKKAETTLNDAEVKSKKIINKAKEEAETQKSMTEKLKFEAVRLKEELRNIYKRHLENIENMPIAKENPQKIFELEEVSNNNQPSLSDDIFTGKAAHLPSFESTTLEFGKNYIPEQENKKTKKSIGVYGGHLKNFKKNLDV